MRWAARWWSAICAGPPAIFAAGDAACAETDDQGHHTLMSCQHALITGRFAGHNAASDLLGLPTKAYRQERYVTCLDLGGWGAVLTQGWQREVAMSGAEAKALKVQINTLWIYPPAPERAVAGGGRSGAGAGALVITFA